MPNDLSAGIIEQLQTLVPDVPVHGYLQDNIPEQGYPEYPPKDSG